jgi:hypothetical protein
VPLSGSSLVFEALGAAMLLKTLCVMDGGSLITLGKARGGKSVGF